MRIRRTKKAMVIVLVFILVGISTLPVAAEVPYQGYTFNFWRDMVPAPVAYIATRSISAADICPELGAFVRPTDFSVDANNIIYLLDTGNNRIVIFDQELNLLRVVYGFENNGARDTFNSPSGIFVCYHFNIYIADTENRRVVILDNNGYLLSMIYNPDLGMIDDEIDFRPQRIVADRAGRVYVIVMHVFEGIMRFDENGQFFGYFGTINVRISAIDVFWRSIATQEQRERQRRFIPTEFSGMDVDEYGFVFATHSGRGDGDGRDQVMRLNPRGNDVIRNLNTNTDISGDQRIFFFDTPSVFIDVVARPNGMFSVLDSTRSRVFTYDSDGNILYVFGGEGTAMGMTRTPVALDVIGDTILVLDAARGRIVYYEPTEYGTLINLAVGLRYQGNEADSVETWQRIMEINEFNTLALAGIGRAHLHAGNYATAMDYLRRGMDLRNYSWALIRRRQEFVDTYLSYFLTGLLAVAVIMAARSVYKNVKGLNAMGEDAYD